MDAHVDDSKLVGLPFGRDRFVCDVCDICDVCETCDVCEGPPFPQFGNLRILVLGVFDARRTHLVNQSSGREPSHSGATVKEALRR